VKSLGPSSGREFACQEVLEKVLLVCSEGFQTYCCPANPALLSVSSVLKGSPGELLRGRTTVH